MYKRTFKSAVVYNTHYTSEKVTEFTEHTRKRHLRSVKMFSTKTSLLVVKLLLVQYKWRIPDKIRNKVVPVHTMMACREPTVRHHPFLIAAGYKSICT
jgi:hypothetical protein